VQDEGSQILSAIVGAKRGEMVVDFCAGAGGKTLSLGATMRNTGRLYAFDVSEKRLAKLKPRLARSGLSNVHPVVIAHERDAKIKRLAGKIDRVLVDAPCSGLGTLRRNPDVKWRQQPDAIAELQAKQAAILDGAARLVKGGGRLVYRHLLGAGRRERLHRQAIPETTRTSTWCRCSRRWPSRRSSWKWATT
jgi:16S rRNA (cytosine967-C5)-methyltransferase